MKITSIFILWFALLISPLATAQQNGRTIFLVRHAEKVSAAADAPLSAAGEQRAECLAKMLKDAGIKQIYVTDVKRTQQTAAPLAKLLNITPTVTPAKDTATLLRNLFYGGTGNALVVGHSDTVPYLLGRLKAGTISPIADNDYDGMFITTLGEGVGTPVVTLHYCAANPAAAPGDMKPPAMKKAPAKKP